MIPLARRPPAHRPSLGAQSEARSVARLGFGQAVLEAGLRTEHLSEVELLLLRSLRLWRGGPGHWNRVWDEHARRFGARRGRETLRAFVQLYDLLGTAARCRLELHHPGCPLLSESEAALLTLVLGAERAADLVACELAGPETAPALSEAARHLVQRYGANGLSAPQRPSGARNPEQALH